MADETFEQQVEQALTGIKLKGTILGASITLGKQVAHEVAPRVAAAIEAAGTADYRENPDERWGYRAQALAALGADR